MKKSTFYAFFAFALALAGCDQKTEIKDGQIPAELLPYAQKLAGTYHGQFEHQSSAMTVALDGNRLTLTPSPDLISPACESKVGNLLEVETLEKDQQVIVTRATFALDPNRCALDIAGRTLTFTLIRQEPITFSVQYLDRVEQHQKCDIVGPTQPGSSPAESCHMESVSWYNTGRYIRD